MNLKALANWFREWRSNASPLGFFQPTVWIGIFALFALSPTAGWIVGGIVLARTGSLSAPTIWTFLAFVPIAIEVNWSKEASGDWQWYTSQFDQYSELHALDIFGETLFPVNQIEEPLYYLLSWFVAHYFSSNLLLLVSLIVALNYGLISLGIYGLARRFRMGSYQALSLQYIVFGFGLTFTLVTHLVRQSLATALLVLAFSALVRGKNSTGKLAVVVSALIHTPSIIIGGMLILGRVFLGSLPQWVMVPLAICAGFASGLVFYEFYGVRYGGVDDGGVSIFVLVVNLIVLSLFGYYAGVVQPKYEVRYLFIVLVLLVSFILGTILEPLPALRFYHYLTPFLALAAGILLTRLPIQAKYSREIALASGLACAIAIQARIAWSPFDFPLGLV